MQKLYLAGRLVAVALLITLAACSGDKGTESTPEITFVQSGSSNVQIWTTGVITFKATAKSGAVPTLNAPALPDNAAFFDSGNGVGTITFSPSVNQLGQQSLKVVGETESAIDSTTVSIVVVDEVSRHVPLIPLELGSRWIYQSVHDRLDNDTVKLTTWTANNGRPIWNGNFFPTLGMLFGGIIAAGDSIYSATLGLQFVVPDHLAAEIEVYSRATCY